MTDGGTGSIELSQTHTKSLQIPHKRQIVIAAAVTAVCIINASLAFAQGTNTEGIDPDCQCRAPSGQMRDLGSVECFDIVGHKALVRCEMSTNTPYWKKVDGIEGCPAA